MRPFRPGYRPTATDLNRQAAELAERDAMRPPVGPGDVGGSFGPHGGVVLDGRQPGHWGKIGTRSGRKYAHKAVYPKADGTWGDLPDGADWPYGSTAVMPAVEASGREDVPAGTVAWLEFDPVTPGYRFALGGGGLPPAWWQKGAVSGTLSGPGSGGFWNPGGVGTFVEAAGTLTEPGVYAIWVAVAARLDPSSVTATAGPSNVGQYLLSVEASLSSGFDPAVTAWLCMAGAVRVVDRYQPTGGADAPQYYDYAFGGQGSGTLMQLVNVPSPPVTVLAHYRFSTFYWGTTPASTWNISRQRPTFLALRVAPAYERGHSATTGPWTPFPPAPPGGGFAGGGGSFAEFGLTASGPAADWDPGPAAAPGGDIPNNLGVGIGMPGGGRDTGPSPPP